MFLSFECSSKVSQGVNNGSIWTIYWRRLATMGESYLWISKYNNFGREFEHSRRRHPSTIPWRFQTLAVDVKGAKRSQRGRTARDWDAFQHLSSCVFLAEDIAVTVWFVWNPKKSCKINSVFKNTWTQIIPIGFWGYPLIISTRLIPVSGILGEGGDLAQKISFGGSKGR